MDASETAKALTALGYTVHPLCPLTPHEHGKGEDRKACASPGKVPLYGWGAWQFEAAPWCGRWAGCEGWQGPAHH